jgi:preprotein translocase subunit YajC
MNQPQAASPLMNLLPLVFIFAIFYFLLIRPQQKQEKARKQMLANVAKNDDVVTTGGIHGTVVNVKDKSVILRVDENVKIEVEKSCVAFIDKKGQSEVKS